MKILVVGFAPKPGQSSSPSMDFVRKFTESASEKSPVSGVELPLEWAGCFQVLQSYLRRGFDAVICVGSKGGDTLAIERLALNECDCSEKDARGQAIANKLIVPNGEPGYWTGLPYRELTLKLNEIGVPAFASHSAGGFLGNYVFYRLMDWIFANDIQTMGGLIQVPEVHPLRKDQLTSAAKCVLDVVTEAAELEDSLKFDLNRVRFPKVSPTP